MASDKVSGLGSGEDWGVASGQERWTGQRASGAAARACRGGSSRVHGRGRTTVGGGRCGARVGGGEVEGGEGGREEEDGSHSAHTGGGSQAEAPTFHLPPSTFHHSTSWGSGGTLDTRRRRLPHSSRAPSHACLAHLRARAPPVVTQHSRAALHSPSMRQMQEERTATECELCHRPLSSFNPTPFTQPEPVLRLLPSQNLRWLPSLPLPFCVSRLCHRPFAPTCSSSPPPLSPPSAPLFRLLPIPRSAPSATMPSS